MSDTIYTDGAGKPFERPEPEPGEPAYLYIRRLHAYQQAITDSANRAFHDAWTAAVRQREE